MDKHIWITRAFFVTIAIALYLVTPAYANTNTIDHSTTSTVTVQLNVHPHDQKPLPSDFQPLVMDSDSIMSALGAMELSGEPPAKPGVPVRKIASNTFELSLNPQTTTPMSIVIHHPDVLRWYFSDLDVAEALRTRNVDLRLPLPATAIINLNLPPGIEGFAQGKPMLFGFSKSLANKSEWQTLWTKEQPIGNTGIKFTLHNVAPGKYGAACKQGTLKEIMYGPRDRIAYAESIEKELLPDTTSTLNFTFKKFNPADYLVSGSLRLKLTKQSGAPASGLAVQLMTYLEDFSAQYSLTSGTLDQEGEIDFNQIPNPVTVKQFKVMSPDLPEKIIAVINTPISTDSLTYQLPLSPGDMAPDATFHDLETQQPIKLSSFQGKVVLLDFWATWCGPCKPSMDSLEKLARKNLERWGDRVVVIGSSIDDKLETAAAHVKKQEWHHIRHFWSGGISQGSNAVKAFSVYQVPTAFLIDQHGKLVWLGYTRGIDLEAEIEKLLKTEPSSS